MSITNYGTFAPNVRRNLSCEWLSTYVSPPRDCIRFSGLEISPGETKPELNVLVPCAFNLGLRSINAIILHRN